MKAWWQDAKALSIVVKITCWLRQAPRIVGFVVGIGAMVSSYRIHLEAIRFRARHGASSSERDLWQDFVVDVSVELPVAELPEDDERHAVYDYDELASLVVQVGTEKSYKLLESLGKALLAAILRSTPATTATVRVKKFGPPTSASVEAVSVEVSSGP